MKLAACLFVLVAPATLASADEYDVDGVNTTGLVFGSTSAESISYRSVPKNFMIIDGADLGGELRFLTADDLAFTDVTLLTLRGRARLAKRVDAALTLDLLPKQPATTDERFVQSAGLVINVQPKQKWPLALHAGGGGGSLLGDTGYWQQLHAGATARKRLHEIVRFEGGANTLATRLGPHGTEGTWLVEAGLAGSVLFRDPEGWTGGWLGFRYSLPLSHTGMLDPQPRMDVEIGVVLSFIEHWDIVFKLAVIDRGDADVMGTQLPILDGGFDQRQAVFGITYHTD